MVGNKDGGRFDEEKELKNGRWQGNGFNWNGEREFSSGSRRRKGTPPKTFRHNITAMEKRERDTAHTERIMQHDEICMSPHRERERETFGNLTLVVCVILLINIVVENRKQKDLLDYLLYCRF